MHDVHRATRCNVTDDGACRVGSLPSSGLRRFVLTRIQTRKKSPLLIIAQR